MSENPYAPPAADLGGEPRVDEVVGRGDFDIGQCLSDGWSNTWSNFPLWLGVGTVGILVGLLAAATVIGVFAVLPVLGWGAVRFGLRMHDGGAELRDLFAGFSDYTNALVGMLVCGLLLILAGSLGQVVQVAAEFSENSLLIALGVLFNLGFSILVTARFGFAYFYVVDRNVPPVESLRRSWEATRPVMWKVVGLLLLCYAIALAGLLALLIGIIPASAVIYLMWVSAFRQLEGRPGPA